MFSNRAKRVRCDQYVFSAGSQSSSCVAQPQPAHPRHAAIAHSLDDSCSEARGCKLSVDAVYIKSCTLGDCVLPMYKNLHVFLGPKVTKGSKLIKKILLINFI